MGSVRRRGGVVRVGLGDPEVVLLASLVAQVKQLLGGDDIDATGDPFDAMLSMPPTEVEVPTDPVLARLLPDAYRDDDSAAGEFRRLMDGDLRAQKCSALQRVIDDLAGGGVRKGDEQRFALDEDGVQQWLYALNDARLALGTAIGVTEDMDDALADLEPESPRYFQVVLYYFVTELQGAILEAEMRG